MKNKFQWLVIAIGGVALAAPVLANPPVQSSSNSRPVARPRASSSYSDAGYRGGATYRGGAAQSFRPPVNYGGRVPTYGGQRFSPMAPRTRTYSGGQRFSSMTTPDRSWRENFPRSNFQRPSSSGSQSDIAQSTARQPRSQASPDFERRRITATTPTRDTDGFDRMRNGRTLQSNRSGNLQNTRTNRSTRFGNVNRGATTTQKAVFDRRSANWQPNWDRNCDHWWNGHRCRFINGSWVIFNLGFYPWWPIGYPFDYYYGYGYYPYDYYGYGYGYGYDQGYYGDQYYDGQGDYYGQDGYAAPDQYGDADSPVAAAQERLAREGYYHGRIDGVFGPETQRALVEFQRDHGLNASGYLTLETRQALGIG